MVVIVCQIQFDWLGGGLGRVMRTDPTAEGLDWKSLADDLRARGLLPPGTVVAALNWRDAGKIGYALGPDVTMLCLSADARQFGFAHKLGDFAGQNVLVLVVDPIPRAGDPIPQAVGTWFQSVDGLVPSSVRLDGRVLKTISVLRGDGLRS
jgi:hypothetical protein